MRLTSTPSYHHRRGLMGPLTMEMAGNSNLEALELLDCLVACDLRLKLNMKHCIFAGRLSPTATIIVISCVRRTLLKYTNKQNHNPK